MTDQTMIATNSAKRIDSGPFDVAPPKAPLLMPTQVIQPDDGVILRVLAPLAALVNLLKHSFRRAG